MPATNRLQLKLLALLVTASALFAGCGPATEVLPPGKDLGSGIAALSADNGLNMNGLSRNGLNLNGLNLNGLNLNGLSTSAFSTWFNGDVVLSTAVMKYLYACSAPLGATLSWTNPTTRVSYFWVGVFGLAPDWTSGKPATEAEQQVVSACLGAHANKFGIHVPIAVEGRTAKGVQIPIGANELSTYSLKEACFFGNLFTGEGIYAGIDHSIWSNTQSSARACAFETTSSSGPSPECAPMFYAGSCSDFCSLDKSKTFYESCTWNGKAYRPLTTRMLPEEVYKCGDGICQISERCGTRSEWWQCRDCGPCP